AHIAIFVFYRKARLNIQSETSSLSQYDPPNSAEKSNPASSVAVLMSFVDEVKVLAPKGMFVPMTDFSDRIDSTIDGMLGTMHDRINLFLVVGIAGTMFGVFEFAANAYEIFKTGDSGVVGVLSTSFSDSIGRAFPVGIFGIFLTIVFQIRSAHYEDELRNAVAGATQKALLFRTHESRSELDRLSNALTAVEAAFSSLDEKMKPLADVFRNRTLEIVEEFGTHIEGFLKKANSQFEDLQESSRSIATSTAELSETTKEVKKTLKDAPKVLGQLSSLAGEHEQALANYKVFSEELKLLPSQMIQKLAESFAEFSVTAETVWAERSESVLKDIKTDMIDYVGSIKTNIEVINKALVETNAKYEELIRNQEEIIPRIITNLREALLEKRPEISLELKALLGELGSIVEKASEAKNGLMQWLQGVGQLHTEINRVREALAAQIDQLKNKPLTGEFAKIVEQLEKSNSFLGRLTKHTPSIALANILSFRIHGDKAKQ
ncbi:MAG: hypothetical protein WEB37_07780, partial [Bacteroidota bacterium]